MPPLGQKPDGDGLIMSIFKGLERRYFVRAHAPEILAEHWETRLVEFGSAPHRDFGGRAN